MKHFAYLIAILTVMFMASATKAEHNQLVSKVDDQSVRNDNSLQIKMRPDTGDYVKHAIKHDIKTVTVRPQKF